MIRSGASIGLFALVFGCAQTAFAVEPELAKINDGTRWRLVNGDATSASDKGQTVARLKPKADASTPSNVGMALVEGVDFGEGALEVDLQGQGDERVFLGLAFNAGDGQHFEAVYFRPFNFTRAGTQDGQAFRSHAVQYVAWPEHTWEKLRAASPLKYEAPVAPIPDSRGWFHARVEVGKSTVRVFVDGAKQPSLVVERLAHGKGRVGLWVDGHDAAFRNFKILPSAK